MTSRAPAVLPDTLALVPDVVAPPRSFPRWARWLAAAAGLLAIAAAVLVGAALRRVGAGEARALHAPQMADRAR